MAVNWQVDPGLVRELAGTLGAGRQAAGGLTGELQRAVAALLTAWSGPAATAFDRRTAPVREQLGDLSDVLAEATAVLGRYATDLERAHQLRRRADLFAASAGFLLDDLGNAVHALGFHHPNLAADIGTAERLGAEATASANEAHLRAATSLHGLANAAWRIAHGRDVDVAADRALGWVGTTPLPSVPAPPLPAGRDAATIAAWWAGLTAAQRTALVAADPKLVGSLGGVPPAWRDWANRIALNTAIAALARERATVAARYASVRGKLPRGRAHASGRARARLWKARFASADARFNRARNLAIQLQRVAIEPRNRLAPTDVFLLNYDLEGTGQAVIALGDPSTADHVGVVVPGTGTDLSNIQNPLRDAAGLRASVGELSNALMQDVSTIAWLDYDTPDRAVPDAALDQSAKEGAPALREFVSGVRVAHDPTTRAHVTILGHSYGSTVVGTAAQQGLGADDLILIGSPGVDAEHASQLRLPESHIWVGQTPDDPIREVFGEDPAGQSERGGPELDDPRLDPVRPLIDLAASPHGPDPADPPFGARRLPLDPEQQHGHSEYYEGGSTGLRNMACIVTGRYSRMQQ